MIIYNVGGSLYNIRGNMTVNNSHNIIETIKEEIMYISNIYDVTIHINPK